MILIERALEEREATCDPVKVGLIGAGFVGTGMNGTDLSKNHCHFEMSNHRNVGPERSFGWNPAFKGLDSGQNNSGMT